MHDSDSTKSAVATTDETALAPALVPKTPEQLRIEQLEQIVREQQAHARGLQSACDAQRALIADQRQEIRGYIEQDVIAGKKWREKFEATAVELRLLQKTGLSSGCGCPIGVCLGGAKSTALGGGCWILWAEGYVMKRRGEVIIDELRTQATHPARVAAAQRQRALAGSEDAKP